MELDAAVVRAAQQVHVAGLRVGRDLDPTACGHEENVGFYNTFVGRVDGPLPDGVEVAVDPDTGDVHLLRGPHYRGIQFHAESILTEHGYDLIHDLVRELLA